ncbi:MAG: baseplate J/gp47 family protein [Bacteroidetes bacterium]|nr:baseplate J/gp47 family protein [Bacteroidota bacterium]
MDLSLSGAGADLHLHFYNQNYLAEISAACNAMVSPVPANRAFPITGGHRLRAGSLAGQVQVVHVSQPDPSQATLLLRVEPIGDYSTYTLSIDTTAFAAVMPAFNPIIDPLFGEVAFKFRPGCFNTNCAPEWDAAKPPAAQPVIDYLAKDYDSFRHTMISAMSSRVPGWEPTSEADLDQVLIDLFSAAADELSDYQDRVMNEAYLATARKRLSLARHARLMDYHIHQGNQAGTWIVLRAAPSMLANTEYHVKEGLEVWAGSAVRDAATLFTVNQPVSISRLMNSMGLYTWSGAIRSLEAGATSADLVPRLETTPVTDHATALLVQNLIRSGHFPVLVVQEWLNPATGLPAGSNPAKRQLLRLIPSSATAMVDPITIASGDPVWFVRAQWEPADALQQTYCFTVTCDGIDVENVSQFHGNVASAYHGEWRSATFREEGSLLGAGERYYRRVGAWGTLCDLPDRDLAYLDTPPGGEQPAISTLQVTVTPPASAGERWTEVSTLVHSGSGDPDGNQFLVETDEERRSAIRFGKGGTITSGTGDCCGSATVTAAVGRVNGRELPQDAVVTCRYQVGRGQDGNVGADMLANYNPATLTNVPFTTPGIALTACWNPFSATNGRAPEPAVEIVRRVPEAYRARQLRAVTLGDYVRRAEEVPQVSRASARYAWTGSWRTVQVTIDPAGTFELDESLRAVVRRHLDTVRLIGEDLEIMPPRFVPLEIHVRLCVSPDYWPEDLRFILEQEFSTGWTPDGRQAFFNPDRWTFGQALRASRIVGVVEGITGVDHVIDITMRRWNGAPGSSAGITDLGPSEIIQVMNDPDHMELGFIDFDIRGGRR